MQYERIIQLEGLEQPTTDDEEELQMLRKELGETIQDEDVASHQPLLTDGDSSVVPLGYSTFAETTAPLITTQLAASSSRFRYASQDVSRKSVLTTALPYPHPPFPF